MLKIEPNRQPQPTTATRAKQTGGNSLADGGAVEDDFSSEASGDFAQIFESLGKKNAASKETDETESKTDEAKFDENTPVKPEEKSSSQEKSSGGKSDDASAGAANSRAQFGTSHTEAEQSLPPARQILHIADLERIVSSVRSQNFDGNSQIVITLKNSVMDGLKIKITADENQRVTAEFIAGNEKVKVQLDARAAELSDLLRQRGVKLERLQTSVGAETGGDNQQNQRAAITEIAPKTSVVKAAEAEEVEASDFGGGVYRA